MSPRVNMMASTMMGVALCGLAVSAAAQTNASTDTNSATHRIVLPLPKPAAAAPASGAATSSPDQAAGQAAIAALLRDMVALRGTPAAAAAGTTAKAPVTVPVNAAARTATSSLTSVAAPAAPAKLTLAANDTPLTMVSQRTSAGDVLGNLAPPAVAGDAGTIVAASPAVVAPDHAAVQPQSTGAMEPEVVSHGSVRPTPAAVAAAPAPPAAQPAVLRTAAVEAPPSAPLLSAHAMGAAAMAGDFSSSEASEQVMHVAVGRTVLIDTRHRLTRIYVTDPTVLNSYTANPNQIVITALKGGSSTVLVWDEAGGTQAYLISADINIDSLQHALTSGFPQDSIHVDGDQDRVVLTGFVGTEEDAINAGKLAGQFTKSVSNSLVVNSSRVKQVRLQVHFIEIDRSKLAQFGFNFFTNGSKNFTVGSTSTNQYSSTVTGTGSTATVSNPLNFSLYSSKLNIGATLQDLATANIAQILAEPTITAMSGEKANFLAGGQFPFPVIQASGGSTAASVTLQFMPYGVKLDFTPKVNPDGTIDLKVTPEVSALDFANAVTLAGYTVPAISTRRADTELVLTSGQSFAISGLLDQRVTDVLSHTPGIASVPILGELFKSKSVNRSVMELVVVVTPTLVDPVSDANVVGAPTPEMIVPFLDKGKFDHDLPKGEKKQN